MKYENKPYRDVVDLLVELSDYFGFSKSVPHFTTLQKFFGRIPMYIWDFLIAKSYQLFNARIANIGIDATGYGLNHSSPYYDQRISRKIWRKQFMKHTISIDTDRLAIVASDSKRSNVNDCKEFGL